MPLDQLLSQLEVEPSSSVTRRLVKLLFNSFHPTNKEADVVVRLYIITNVESSFSHTVQVIGLK